MRDDLNRDLYLMRPPSRIVSLVPSETHTLFALGVGDRVVGRTEYCVAPAGAVESIPTCGGTKSIDVDKVLSLAPDLVVANQEENTRHALEAIAQRGVSVFVSFPCRAADAIAHLARLARICSVEKEPAVVDLIRRGYEVIRGAEARGRVGRPRVFVPIWNPPWMTISADTYASDLLAAAGAENAFADRVRAYPLAADLGKIEPISGEEIGSRDIRYPRIGLDEIVARKPDIILLPDEPHECSAEEEALLAGLPIPAAEKGAIRRVSGKDLFWYGAHTVEALPRLADLVAELSYN